MLGLMAKSRSHLRRRSRFAFAQERGKTYGLIEYSSTVKTVARPPHSSIRGRLAARIWGGAALRSRCGYESHLNQCRISEELRIDSLCARPVPLAFRMELGRERGRKA
jgi:hypothetical protein